MNEALRKRREAWDAFAQWERENPEQIPPFGELVAWLGRALAIARAAGPLPEPSPEEKAARLALIRERLAALRSQG
jgi:hypothetical protein